MMRIDDVLLNVSRTATTVFWVITGHSRCEVKYDTKMFDCRGRYQVYWWVINMSNQGGKCPCESQGAKEDRRFFQYEDVSRLKRYRIFDIIIAELCKLGDAKWHIYMINREFEIMCCLIIGCKRYSNKKHDLRDQIEPTGKPKLFSHISWRSDVRILNYDYLQILIIVKPTEKYENLYRYVSSLGGSTVVYTTLNTKLSPLLLSNNGYYVIRI